MLKVIEKKKSFGLPFCGFLEFKDEVVSNPELSGPTPTQNIVIKKIKEPKAELGLAGHPTTFRSKVTST